MIPRLTLETQMENEKYLLRCPEISDIPQFYKLVDKDVTHFLSFNPPKDLEESGLVIDDMRKKVMEGGRWTSVIIEKVSNQIIGTISINKYFDNENTIEFGYWLRKEYWGRGIMTEVVRFLTDYAFSKMKVRKTTISAQVDNIGSRKIAEKIGAKLDGVLRENKNVKGKLVDIAVYSLFEEEFIR